MENHGKKAFRTTTDNILPLQIENSLRTLSVDENSPPHMMTQVYRSNYRSNKSHHRVVTELHN